MFSRSSWLHLRIPFSLFLLPIFLFCLAVSPHPGTARSVWVFIILHLLLYPASNGYNSYFDKDEKSIGGLKHPPPVKKGLYALALTLDAFAIALSLININTTFAAMALTYGLISKAYSHPSIRLKKFAWTSWVITGLFQGLFTFAMCYSGINDVPFHALWGKPVVLPGILTSFMLWANYPLTQVYQHEEDLKRGDLTLSAKLGVQGTFLFSAVFFILAVAGIHWYLNVYAGTDEGWRFLAAVLPTFIYFLYWFARVVKNRKYADYQHTMRLNFISAICLNAFFIYLFVWSSMSHQLPS
jgi:1,4-dihydroxy-2-naphthoate octaprenyltransferase